MIQIKIFYETILKSKYNDKIIYFLNDIKNIEIKKGVLTHNGVNVSEIAFIKKK